MAEIAYVCRLNNEVRTFRARLDPFDEFKEVKFRQRYRVSKDVAMELATDLEASQWSTLGLGRSCELSNQLRVSCK